MEEYIKGNVVMLLKKHWGLNPKGQSQCHTLFVGLAQNITYSSAKYIVVSVRICLCPKYQKTLTQIFFNNEVYFTHSWRSLYEVWASDWQIQWLSRVIMDSSSFHLPSANSRGLLCSRAGSPPFTSISNDGAILGVISVTTMLSNCRITLLLMSFLCPILPKLPLLSY